MVNNTLNLNFLKKDILASIIVFLIALPLAIGISIACGLPVYSGIISAIIGGVVVGIFSGNPLQVSGPATGLILLIVDIINSQGVEALFLTIILAGLFQITFGLFSLGGYFRAISPAIIQGMLAGIGVSIFVSQFVIMLDAKPKANFFENILYLKTLFSDFIFNSANSQGIFALIIGLITILTIIVWHRLPSKRIQILPAGLIAIILSTFVAQSFDFQVEHISLGSNFWQNFKFIDFSQFKNIFDFKIFINACVITLIASAETLLTSNALDKINKKIKTNYNKEIIAQGIGNTLSGLVCGLPITGVIVRSAANINAQAQTRCSTILHGIWILLFVTFFPQVINYVPQATLAAILVYTGYKLIDINAAKKIYSLSRGEFVIYVITVVAILFSNLFTGIVIAFLSALIKSVYKMLSTNVTIDKNELENTTNLILKGEVIFLHIPKLVDILDKLPKEQTIHIDATNLHFIDHACVDLLHDWELERRDAQNINIDWNLLKKSYPNFRWENFD
ncbi:MAG: SulP family inorganic anion transporter [Candidatus Gastranaerophilales bacterium]